VGFYKSPVAVLDFASLYPSIQVAFKICYTTIVLSLPVIKLLERKKGLNEPLEINGTKFDFIEWEDNVISLVGDPSKFFTSAEHAKEELGISKKDILKDILGPKKKFQRTTKKYLFFFAQNTESIIPDIQVSLKKNRKSVRKDMGSIEFSENLEEQLRYRVLNGRQLAIKTTMNSIYGFTSAFMLHLSALAACVTAKGRQMIEATKFFMEKEFEEIARTEKWTIQDVTTYYDDNGREIITENPKSSWNRKFPAAEVGKNWTIKSLKINVVGGGKNLKNVKIIFFF
jgi:DNA polymerase elongation subunit (family B)